MTIVPATIDMLEALQRSPAEFADLIGSPVPDGWPEFPEAIEFTIDTLRDKPREAQWWLHFFLDGDGLLVGSGGFVGPPDDGVVEIGYEIAPGLRGRGLATAAAQAMVAKAFATVGVHTVIAHTLARPSASTSVLGHLGFGFVGEVADPEEGTIWRWELAAPPA